MRVILNLQEAGWAVDSILKMTPERLIKLLNAKEDKSVRHMTADEYIQEFGVGGLE